jgi:hypothetical protein
MCCRDLVRGEECTRISSAGTGIPRAIQSNGCRRGQTCAYMYMQRYMHICIKCRGKEKGMHLIQGEECREGEGIGGRGTGGLSSERNIPGSLASSAESARRAQSLGTPSSSRRRQREGNLKVDPALGRRRASSAMTTTGHHSLHPHLLQCRRGYRVRIEIEKDTRRDSRGYCAYRHLAAISWTAWRSAAEEAPSSASATARRREEVWRSPAEATSAGFPLGEPSGQATVRQKAPWLFQG